MTKREQQIMTDLIEACLNATAYFNNKAQGQVTGLNKRDDDLRQQLCNAASAALGKVYCGNLQRTSEAQAAIDRVNQISETIMIPYTKDQSVWKRNTEDKWYHSGQIVELREKSVMIKWVGLAEPIEHFEEEFPSIINESELVFRNGKPNPKLEPFPFTKSNHINIPNSIPYKANQRVKKYDSEDKCWVYGHVVALREKSVMIRWPDIKEPTEHFEEEFPSIKDGIPGVE